MLLSSTQEHCGHVAAMTVSHWLPTTTSDHMGFVVKEIGIVMFFLQYLGFPCQFSSLQVLHKHTGKLQDCLKQESLS
jgi:hypothetical protein